MTKAIYWKDNQDIWKDSCCEFFISFTDYKEQRLETNYFNFELNCLGRCLSMIGDRNVPNRKFLNSTTSFSSSAAVVVEESRLLRTFSSGLNDSLKLNISRLETFSEIKDSKNEWQLTFAIPWDLFGGFEQCMKKSIRANFYKCGDELSRPHWISFFPIGSETPSFHRPEFFGLLNFK